MIKEAIDRILGLASPSFFTDPDGHQFANQKLIPVNRPLITPIAVTTLGGFCDLITEGFEGIKPIEVIAHVESHQSVSLVSIASDAWGRRTEIISCDLPDVKGFSFEQFMDHETFIIRLQAIFTPTADLDYLLKLASNLSTERVQTSEDDGITQKATLKQGVVLKGQPQEVKARVNLAPFRTFREVAQPASDFIFRLRNAGENQPPTLALFEADGGKWKLEAMENIGRYLRVKLGEKEVAVVI